MEAKQKLKYSFAITIQSRSENDNTTNIIFFYFRSIHVFFVTFEH